MNNILGHIFIYLVIFLGIFLILRIVTIISTKRHLGEMSVPIKYISNKYKVEIRETKAKKIRIIIDLINTIAASIPIYLIAFNIIKLGTIPKYILLMLIFIVIIIGGYNLVGLILKRKEK